MTDISNAELVRRLDEAIKHLTERDDDLIDEVRELRRDLKDNYVQVAVYAADERTRAAERETDRAEVAVIGRRLDSAEQFRRQVMAGAAVGVILLAVNLLIALSNFMARGGA